VLFAACCIINKGLKWMRQWRYFLSMVFVMLFPLLENLIMKEHAISYTYDRMKMVYPLMLFAFLLITSIVQRWKNAWIQRAFAGIMVCVSICNVYCYVGNTELLWAADYREKNEEIAAYCMENYPEDSLYGMNGAAVRGYMNMLFHRGIYENVSEEELMELAKERGVRYAVLITPASEPSPDNSWGMYAIDHVTVIDMNTGMEEIVQK
jgi:hypothetical protein